jgi:hypothetical protein
MDQQKHIIITRHPALVRYLRERGIAPADAMSKPHACATDVRGKHVYGVLPLRLAALAECVTEVPLRLEECDRGREIPYDRLCEIAGGTITYKVSVTSMALAKPNKAGG